MGQGFVFDIGMDLDCFVVGPLTFRPLDRGGEQV